MKYWLWRVLVAFVVAFSGMAGQAVAAPGHEGGVGDDLEIAVFLCAPSAARCHKRYATAKQRRELGAFLKSVPEVTEVRFVSRAAAYAAFRREFAGRKKTLAGVRAKDLPESFRVRVSGVADRARVLAAAESRPGVWWVVDQADGRFKTQPSWNEDFSVLLCTGTSFTKGCERGRGSANDAAATAKEKKAIVAAIERIPGLESYVFEDQQTAYRNFVETYADDESLILATRMSDMPMRYRLWVRPKGNPGSWGHRLAGMPGVSQVDDLGCLAEGVRFWLEYGLENHRSWTRECELR
ncbi:permease-like cell division protein FtsX [Nonomuraea sp. NPDC001699]